MTPNDGLRPFRPPHGEDCPVCHPHDGIGGWILLIVIALIVVALLWYGSLS